MGKTGDEMAETCKDEKGDSDLCIIYIVHIKKDGRGNAYEQDDVGVSLPSVFDTCPPESFEF
jgi:hypothetical protein